MMKVMLFHGRSIILPGVKLFQMTQMGLALLATIQGTKCIKDDDLSQRSAGKAFKQAGQPALKYVG
jgi:hypothetical protein